MIYTTPLATKQKSPSGTTRLGQKEQPSLLYQAPNHMAKPQPLSPTAQAVLDAAHDGANTVLFDIGNDSPVPMCAAAALRAIADNAPAPHHHEEMAFHSGFWAGIEYIRSIAAELEGLDG